MTYGTSEVRDGIEAAAAGLHRGHNNAQSEPGLQPTLQLTAMPNP